MGNTIMSSSSPIIRMSLWAWTSEPGSLRYRLAHHDCEETQVVASERPVAGIPVLITGVQCAVRLEQCWFQLNGGRNLICLLADRTQFEAGSLVHFRSREERQGGVIDL